MEELHRNTFMEKSYRLKSVGQVEWKSEKGEKRMNPSQNWGKLHPLIILNTICDVHVVLPQNPEAQRNEKKTWRGDELNHKVKCEVLVIGEQLIVIRNGILNFLL